MQCRSTIMAFRCPPELTFRNAARLFGSVSTAAASAAGSVGAERSSSSPSSSAVRVALCTELGKPLQIATKPQQPLANNKQVRMAVDYCGINFGDILTIGGLYQVKISPPFVPGVECCGHVSEVGSDVTSLKPGDKVINCGMAGNGGFSQEIVADSEAFFRIDNGIPTDVGSALILSYATAYTSLVHRVGIKQSDVVLVTAAAGALGLATVDIAANVVGAKVIAVCGSEDKCSLTRRYGAESTINYNTDDVRETVKQLTNSRGVDVAVDVVGGQLLEDCLRSMAFEGRLLTLGYAGGQIPKLPANVILMKNCSVHGVLWGNYFINKPEMFRSSAEAVIKLCLEKKIHPHIGQVFPLTQVNEAIQYITSRKSTGKVILDCKT